MTYLVTGTPQHLRVTLSRGSQGAGAHTSMLQQQQEGMNKSSSYSEMEDHRNNLTKLTNNFQITANMLMEWNTLSPALSALNRRD